jgi:hypothetical protein
LSQVYCLSRIEVSGHGGGASVCTCVNINVANARTRASAIVDDDVVGDVVGRSHGDVVSS